MKNKSYQFPFVWIQEQTHVRACTISDLHRREKEDPVDTIVIDKGALVDTLTVRDLTLENATDASCEKTVNRGTIGSLRLSGLSERDIKNYGTIEKLIVE